jgi:hypothetical protein
MNQIRIALALAPIALSFAAAAPACAQVQLQIQTGADGLYYGVSTVQAQACQAGSAGSWLEANGAAVESGDARRMTLTFGTPVATDTLHAAMNKVAQQALALIEVADADGNWHKAWEGQLAPPAPAFAQQTCYEHQLPQKQLVQALRFTFRAAPGPIEVNHAALLRR